MTTPENLTPPALDSYAAEPTPISNKAPTPADIPPSLESGTGTNASFVGADDDGLEPDHVSALAKGDPLDPSRLGEQMPTNPGTQGEQVHSQLSSLEGRLTIDFQTQGIYLYNPKTRVIHRWCAEFASHKDALPISGSYAVKYYGYPEAVAIINPSIEHMADRKTGVISTLALELDKFRRDLYYEPLNDQATAPKPQHTFADFAMSV